MINDPKQFLNEQQKERARYLQALTIPQSVHLLESLLTSGLLQEFKFSDNRPIGLSKSTAHARKRV